MQKERKDKSFIKKPIFPGGLKAMRMLIKEELQYPEAALKNKTEGTVYLRYDIDYKGNVVGAKVLSGLGNGCDEEAIRLVHLFKFDIPKGPRKVKVTFHKTIKIHFRLPKESKIETPVRASETEIVYTISKSKTKPQNQEDHSNPGYSYTIQWK